MERSRPGPPPVRGPHLPAPARGPHLPAPVSGPPAPVSGPPAPPARSAALRPGRQRFLRPRTLLVREAMPQPVTRHNASTRMSRLIFESPISRSTKVMGTSTTW